MPPVIPYLRGVVYVSFKVVQLYIIYAGLCLFQQYFSYTLFTVVYASFNVVQLYHIYAGLCLFQKYFSHTLFTLVYSSFNSILVIPRHFTLNLKVLTALFILTQMFVLLYCIIVHFNVYEVHI